MNPSYLRIFGVLEGGAAMKGWGRRIGRPGLTAVAVAALVIAGASGAGAAPFAYITATSSRVLVMDTAT